VTVSTFAMAQLLRVLPRTRITRAVGRLCDMPLPPPLSRAIVSAYVRAYDVELDEAAPLNGRGAYESFDAFFTRELRRGARAMPADPFSLASPADGRLDAVGPVGDGQIIVKGRPYDARALLLSDAAAERYRGGEFAVIYLSPRDYHRVHAPARGRLLEVRSAAGELFPVNSISERHIPQFLTRNRRVAIELATDHFGHVTLVMVAAMIVGRITVTGIEAPDVPIGTVIPERPRTFDRGDEMGIFHLGSTVVLFFEPPSSSVSSLRRDALVRHPLGSIRWGAALNEVPNDQRGHPANEGADG
jgi:phosphatidylserine decarboxylase